MAAAGNSCWDRALGLENVLNILPTFPRNTFYCTYLSAILAVGVFSGELLVPWYHYMIKVKVTYFSLTKEQFMSTTNFQKGHPPIGQPLHRQKKMKSQSY